MKELLKMNFHTCEIQPQKKDIFFEVVKRDTTF